MVGKNSREDRILTAEGEISWPTATTRFTSGGRNKAFTVSHDTAGALSYEVLDNHSHPSPSNRAAHDDASYLRWIQIEYDGIRTIPRLLAE